MDNTQKKNLIRTARRAFECRLEELRRYQPPRGALEEMVRRREREDELVQCVRFCRCLELSLREDGALTEAGRGMLHYIGLDSLWEEY